MKKYNKKIIIAILGIVVLFLPLLTIEFAYNFFDKKIWDNPDFWYGYMAYFGTVLLAIVSLIQNMNANENNDRFMTQQLRQKIGYFELKKTTANGKISPYQDIYIDQVFTIFREPEPDKNAMHIFLENVGEDIILHNRILHCRLNQEDTDILCIKNSIYKNEEIEFQIDCTKYINEQILRLEILFQMNNTAGISYAQKIDVDMKKKSNEEKTYVVTSFGTDIEF